MELLLMKSFQVKMPNKMIPFCEKWFEDQLWILIRVKKDNDNDDVALVSLVTSWMDIHINGSFIRLRYVYG